MALKKDLPLLNHPLKEPTAFTPEALVAAVRAERGLPLEPVPPVCILEFDGDLTDWLVSTGAARPWSSWACFHTTMFSVEVDGVPYGIIPRTIGGPYAVLVAEQLVASGAQVVIGLTSAGRVSPSLPIPSFVIATQAVRDEGTSYHYLPASERIDAPPGIIGFMEAEMRSLGPPVSRGLVWTTDAPYRETEQQLTEHANAGVLAVEMQAASLFAFAIARQATVGLVAHVTNAIDHAGEPFDKGSKADGQHLVEALCHAGARFILTPKEVRR